MHIFILKYIHIHISISYRASFRGLPAALLTHPSLRYIHAYIYVIYIFVFLCVYTYIHMYVHYTYNLVSTHEQPFKLLLALLPRLWSPFFF